ncbi:type IV secretion protein Rhs [Glycomyces algeriensis]|uniref:Type IV secretion protein Rhs n=2 Tax=Glycomyces algeriensis TaxID=256037 RepID=A0A9W6LGX0_9ACTN|nr:type IV secretion protein Rhs [Glycomyces algeriensis]
MTAGPALASEFQRGAQSTSSTPVGGIGAAESSFNDAAADWAGSTETAANGGDWSATDLASAGSWSQGGSSGGYSYSYGMRVPPATGPAPSLSLSYSSATHDGLTSGTNNQASWIGDGWGYSPGFIERTYAACGSEAEQDGNNGEDPTGDLCWDGDSPSITMSLNGTNTPLVLDDATGEWRAASDANWRIEKLGAAANGSNATTERWKITTTDGTQYLFAADPTTTASRWTVPVFGNHSGEPCYTANDFDASRCAQAYRWMLDQVIDVRGNMTRYVYGTETGYYSPNVDSEAAAVAYTRAGWLKRIEYGLRSGEPTVKPTGRVQLIAADRCLSNCYNTSGSPKESSWPDIPWDLQCDSGTGCEQYAPAFFSTKRLSKITTEVWNTAGGVFDTVDSWTLAHKFKAYGDKSQVVLWLSSIQHTGHVGGTATLPAVEFGGTFMPNRVDDGSANPSIQRPRLTSIKNESGGVTTVNYSEPDCGQGNLPTQAENNTKRCYPASYVPEGTMNSVEAYFHKYVVTQVAETDTTGESATVWTSYQYSTAGGGTSALWAWDDSEFTEDEDRTYNQWRGYSQVTTLIGDPAGSEPHLRSAARYYRGMNGQPLPDGSERSVTLASTRGDTIADHEALAGQVWEQIVYDGSTIIGSTTTQYWTRNTGTRTHDGGDLKAWMSAPRQVEADTKLSTTAWRTTRTTTTEFDDYGRATEVSTLGDTATSGDERCQHTTFADNTAKWILQAPSRIETVSVPCSTENPSRPGDIVGDVRAYYDGKAFGAAPTYGEMTKAETLDHWDADPVYATLASSTFDALGRQITTTDALGATTSIVYTPAGAGPVTKMTTTNPLGHIEIGVLAPAWGSVLSATGVNGEVTSATYDALGRRTAVWLPGQSQTGGAVPNLKFAYTVSDIAPSTTTTETMIWDQSYLTEVQIFDALMRPRQTQAETYGGRLITQTEYDSRGQVIYESGASFNNDSGPTADLVRISRSNDVSRTEYVYDGAGRITDQIFVVKDDEQWRITTAYGGNDDYWQETTTPPDGASATGTLTDALGRTVEVHRYLGNTPTGTPDTTSYDYTAAGLLETVTDPAQNIWTFTYDLRGRKIAADDPDSGHTDLTYNAADQVISTTTTRTTEEDTTLAYVYDELGRKTELWEGAVGTGGTLLSEWTYDTAVNGLGLPHTSTNWIGGKAWTDEVYEYDDAGRPIEIVNYLPSTAGALAGEYWQVYSYHPDGSLRTSRANGVGSLRPETMRYHYNAMGQPTRVIGESPDFGAAKVYVDAATYSPYGQLLQRRLGDPADVGGTSGQAWQTWIFEEGTGRLSEFYFDKDTAGEYDGTNYGIAALSYEYDDAGNVLSITDEPVHTSEALAPETQCFQYDHHRRLTEAWSQAGTGDCATTPSASVIGGPADYWSSYEYDLTGNRTSENRWNGSSQTTYDYTFPAARGDHPHALSEVTSTANGGERTAFTYDKAGYTTSIDRGGDLALLDWTATGRLDTIKQGEDATTQFFDDAQGKRIARIDPNGDITAWVAGYELHYNATTGVKQATRYYTHGGSAIAVRVGKGDIQFLSGDHHGTGQWIVNGNTLTTKVRRFDPFGNDRSATAWVERDGTYGSDTWPDERGFIGGIDNKNLGLTTIGAREYDPIYGRFISVDPIADYADAQQLNGYAYALNNPLVFSDPTGLSAEAPIPGMVPTYCGGTPFGCTGWHWPDNDDEGTSPTPDAPDAPDSPSSPGNNTSACVPSSPTFDGEGPISAGCGTSGSILDFGAFLLSGIVQAVYTLTVEDAVNCANDPNWTDCIFAVVGFVPGAGKLAGFIGDLILKYADELLPYGDDVAAGATKACNSFVAGTLVVMADGTVKPIEEVKAGEEVLAQDVTTGEVVTAVVSDTMTTPEQLRNLVTIEVDTDGDGKGDAQITATAGHAFWEIELSGSQESWSHASDLQVGSWLKSIDGTWVEIIKTSHFAVDVDTFNLSVKGLHTYFITANDDSILVHNQATKCTVSDGAFNHAWDDHKAGGTYHQSGDMGNVLADDITESEFRKMIDEAIKNGTRTPRSSSDPREGFLIRYEFDDNIGYNGQYTIELAFDANGNLSTAYPTWNSAG